MFGNGAVQFGRYIPSFTPLTGSEDFTIISRELSTVCLSPTLATPQISYTLITANPLDCGAVSTPVQLQYRQDNAEWTALDPRKMTASLCSINFNYGVSLHTGIDSTHSYNTHTMAHIQMTSFLVKLDARLMDSNKIIQFRFVQLEHRGGYCDCWGVANLKVIHKDLA